MFLGFDCSTQSLSALLIDVEKGTIEHEASVRFEEDLPDYQTHHGFVRGTEPDEFFSSPMMWVEALDLLCQRMKDDGTPLHKVQGIAGSAQQHSTVHVSRAFQKNLLYLDPSLSLKEQLKSTLTRPVAPIWMDASTLRECEEIASAVGGHGSACHKTGSTVIPRFSAAQIRKYAHQFPDRWEETHKVHLVSSFMSSIFVGRRSAIDYGDGAGMNLMNLKSCNWDAKMLDATASGLFERLPSLQPSSNVAGKIAYYFVKKYGFNQHAKCYLWSGDNPCSLVGMGASRPGNWVISLGTSYTHFAATRYPDTDPNGYGHVFGNPIDGYMALNCFKNGALACFSLKEQLDIDWLEFDKRALTPPTISDIPALPFYETEITPAHRAEDQSDTTVRSLLDGQFLNMRLHSKWLGKRPSRILVTGGASQSLGICQTIANIFQLPVHRLQSSSSASLGAAMRAAHGFGYHLDELEAKFCKTRDEISQETGSAQIYDYLLKQLVLKLNRDDSTQI